MSSGIWNVEIEKFIEKSSDDLKQNFAGGTFKKGGDQLSKNW